jgi:hypothetical protein
MSADAEEQGAAHPHEGSYKASADDKDTDKKAKVEDVSKITRKGFQSKAKQVRSQKKTMECGLRSCIISPPNSMDLYAYTAAVTFSLLSGTVQVQV